MNMRNIFLLAIVLSSIAFAVAEDEAKFDFGEVSGEITSETVVRFTFIFDTWGWAGIGFFQDQSVAPTSMEKSDIYTVEVLGDYSFVINDRWAVKNGLPDVDTNQGGNYSVQNSKLAILPNGKIKVTFDRLLDTKEPTDVSFVPGSGKYWASIAWAPRSAFAYHKANKRLINAEFDKKSMKVKFSEISKEESS